MAIGNFTEFGAKCLHPKSPLRKIIGVDGDNPSLRILRKFPVIPVETFHKEALTVRKKESTWEELRKEEEGTERETQEGEMGPSDKACFKTLAQTSQVSAEG